MASLQIPIKHALAASQIGYSCSLCLLQDFLQHPEIRGPNFTWDWFLNEGCPTYVKNQLLLHFSGSIKKKYKKELIKLALEAGNEVLNTFQLLIKNV